MALAAASRRPSARRRTSGGRPSSRSGPISALAGRRADAPQRRHAARPTCTCTRSTRTGPPASRRCSSTSRRRPTGPGGDHRSRAPGRRCAPARSMPPATSTSSWWWARRSPPAAATCWPCSSRSASRPAAAARTLERIHEQGGLAIAAHPLAPLTPACRRSLALHDDPDPRTTWTPSSCSTPARPVARRLERNSLNEHVLHLAAVGNSDAHVLEHVGTGWTWFPGTTAGVPAGHRGSRHRAGRRALSSWHNVSVYGRQLVAKARHLRHTLRPTGEWR